jgi:hypothetical protein
VLADIITDALARVNAGRSPTLGLKVGERHLGANDAHTRIVWVPSDDSFAPAVQVGGNPRAVATRVAGVEVHVWAATMAEAEALVNDLVVAWHGATGRHYDLRGGEWKTAGELMNDGFGYLLRLTAHLPIVRAAPVTVRPETTTSTTDIA